MRRLGIVVLAIVTLLLVAVVALRGWLGSSVAEYDRDVAVSGIRAPVEIWRDSLAVPHVWAESLPDLLFAQGYVHAQDRLWQMELFRRVAEGRLSEVMGEAGLDSDRFLRTLGLWRAAGENEARLTAEERALFASYAAGVNAYIENRKGALPPEFVALRIEPEPWTVRHSLAIEKIMAWDLAAYGTGLSLARAARELGPERARLLHPAYPTWGATILEDTPLPELPEPAATLLDAGSIARASNSWVIGPSRSASGKPILANDMHLALRAPAIWHLMALHGGGVDVVGMTLPGAPFVVAGHNRAIAWGFTNAMVDDADFFIERLDPAESARYLVPGGSEPLRVIRDSIRVKGRDAAVPLTIRLTRHGPILNDVQANAGDDLLALRWVALDTTDTNRGLRILNSARNWDEFAAGVASFDNPHQNVMYADTSGRFGYWMAGRVPVRGTGRPPPLTPVPGWTGEWDWSGELPIGEHPHTLDPPSGYAVSANNRQVAGAAGERITSEWAPPYRAMRIAQMARACRACTADSVRLQQMDVLDLQALRHIRHAVAAAEAVGDTGTARLLRNWDGRATAGSRAAAVYQVWWSRLRRAAARDLYGRDGGWFPGEVLDRALDAGALPWRAADAADAADAPDAAAALRQMAAKAMQEADSIAGGRTWGELHAVASIHPLAQAAALEKVLDLNVGPAPAGGTASTVNVLAHTGGFPGVASYGASQRHVVDMGNVDGTGGFILPTGQSGVPFSKHYRDHFERYRRGELWLVPLGREAARARIVRRMVLEPR